MTKTWTELLGTPQSSDCVYGTEIVRNTKYFTLGDFGVRRPIFQVLWKFDSKEKANEVFDSWIEENK